MVTGGSRWHVVHPSGHAHEQEALDLLRAQLPETPPFCAWSNFEFIADDGSINEIDALIVSSDRIYLVEIKHWSGRISGNQNSWLIRSPSGRERYEENPLLLANRKAKKLKSLLGHQQAFRKGQVPYIQAVVFLSSPQCEVALDEIAAQHIHLRPDARHRGQHSIVDVIQGRATESEGRPGVSRDAERALARAMEQLGLRKRTRAATVGDYLLTGLIAENDRYQDWEAKHQRVGTDLKRIRIFPHAQRAAESEKRERKDIATREYELLRDIRHDGILSPRQLTESDVGPALVYDFDPEAQRLDHLLDAADTSPGISERLDLIRAIAESVAYAHSRNVHHRALSPWTIELHRAAGDRHRPVLRDWQSGIAGQDTTAGTRMTMHLGQQAGVIDNPRSAVYVAPEVVAGHGYDAVAIDMFSLGALTYALFSGQHPAATVEEMLDKVRSGPGLMISEVLDGAPDSLQLLVQVATDPNPADRPSDVREFLRMLDDVEEELTAPEPERGASPADARQGDRLTGGFQVLRRLGAGSTCHALAVEDPQGQQGVLKVAKDPSFNERLRQEYETLREVPHPNIVKALGLHEIDGLAAIFIEQAGDKTMGQRLREQGPLSLDLLERFGDELLGVVVHLEREGINHRDIKPENIGLGETRKRALTLKLFDFSLARAPADNIRAGTPPYLDPFLSLRRPARWDLHAERFAAAMTLHEMATGTLPTWGTAGQDPASTAEDVGLDVEKFDASIRDGLADFFRRALHRDSKKRFDNADDMYLAWKNLFRHIDQTTLDEDSDSSTTLDFSRVENLSRDTPLSVLGLSARELNAADRIGATNVGQLLALPGIRFYRNRGIGQQITRRLRQVREELAARLGQAAAPDLPDEQPGVSSIDRLVESLERVKLEDGEAGIVSHWLGLADASPRAGLDLPSQRDVAEAAASSRAQVQAAIDRAAEKWAKNAWMTALRDEVTAFLQRRECVATLGELATALLSAHGSTAADTERQRLAVAVIQATLEVEAARESARFVLYRGHEVTLIVAADPQGAEARASTSERVAFVEALAAEAKTLAAEDPLPSPRRVEQALMAVPAPAGDPPMSLERRLRLAVAAAPAVAMSSRLELYPVNLPAERALRLGANTLLGARRLSVEQLHSRIHSRFPKAECLPGRPALDHLLQQIEFPLQWHEAGDALPAGYAMPVQGTGATRHTSTLRRLTTAMHAGEADSPAAQQAQAFDATVRRAIAGGRVLLVTTELKRVEDAAPELCQQYGLTPVSLDHLLIEALRAQVRQIRADWGVVLQADAATQSSADWRRLTTLVERAMPTLTRQLLDDDRPLLIQHLGLLVRYGQTGLIQTLRNAAQSRPRPARLLLLPGDSQQPPMLDGVVLPVITPADWTHLPRSWLENRHRADSAAAASGTTR
ncbi:BREX system serine/threonine kinase PglW [Luteimonas sp. MC1572]|uniref:BREX system serine/threonine kinase PglW n=1 Tax=Luteimonas sp. MC1572 TaxID=2799325 RepID=UPI0018F1064F|nr:BREX system serine/threonine kinase PglW [Luteimonas sp. MC1572]MBJ6981998.1 BREX system serine/threonine kinase PglW [Luteimonas sp. MC1572]QQO03297.1 BREX system serine/threonine kinase PglW [Luteimonas sp. MC1572]